MKNQGGLLMHVKKEISKTAKKIAAKVSNNLLEQLQCNETDYPGNANVDYCHIADREFISDDFEFPYVQLWGVLNAELRYKSPFPLKMEEKIERLGINKEKRLSLLNILQTFGFLPFCLAFNLSDDADIIDCSVRGWRLKIYLINKALELCSNKQNDRKLPATIKEVEQWIHNLRTHYDEIVDNAPPLLLKMLRLIFGKKNLSNVTWSSVLSAKPMNLLQCIQLLIDASIIQKHDEPIKTFTGEDLNPNISKFNYLLMEIASQVLSAYFYTSLPEKDTTDKAKTATLLSLEDMGWLDLVRYTQMQLVVNCRNRKDYKKQLMEKSDDVIEIQS